MRDAQKMADWMISNVQTDELKAIIAAKRAEYEATREEWRRAHPLRQVKSETRTV